MQQHLKPQAIVNSKVNLLLALVVFAGSFIVYLLTQARTTLLWDAGEYITCSSILGIAHPPGNPFYILLGRFFVILFGGALPHAFVVNMLSGIFSALAVMFTYLFTVKISTMWLSKKEAHYAYLAGFIAAFYTAFSFTFWNNAVEAEVYSGLAFFINFSVWLTFVWLEKSNKLSHQHLLLLIIYVIFLGFGIHQTSLQIAPAILFVVLFPMLTKYYHNFQKAFWLRTIVYFVLLLSGYGIGLAIARSIKLPDAPKYFLVIVMIALLIYHLRHSISTKAWLLALFVICLGFSTHLFLNIRSEFRPFINEGHPATWQAFKDYVLRTQYGPTSMFNRRATFLYQMKDQFLSYFSWQFFHVKTIAEWLKAPEHLLQIFANLFVLLLGIKGIFYHFKKNRISFYYFFAFFFMASVAMVFVMNLSDQEVRQRDYFFTTAYNFWTFWLALGSIALIWEAKKIKKSLSYVMIFLVLFFPALNLVSQYRIHDYSRNYTALDYGLNLLNGLEENAILITNGDNDTFPLWYAQAVEDPLAFEHKYPAEDVYPTEKTKALLQSSLAFKNKTLSGIRKDVSVVVKSLLQTPWYIRQLKEKEGIEFNISEKDIDTFYTNRESALYPKRVQKNTIIKIKGPQSQQLLQPILTAGTVLRTDDLVLLQILQDNYGKRPIYFALTPENSLGLERYLQLEGLVYKVGRPTNDKGIQAERVVKNIEDIYTYRTFMNEKVYLDEEQRKIKHQHGHAFLMLHQFFYANGDIGKAIHYFEEALPFLRKPSLFYPPLSDLYTHAAVFLAQNEMAEEAFLHIENAVYYHPKNDKLPEAIYQIGAISKFYDKSIAVLEEMENQHDTATIQLLIDELLILKIEQKNDK
jgi:hypothetical protein